MSDLSCLENIDGYRRLFTDVAFWEPYIKDVCQKHDLKPDRPVRIGIPGTCPTFIVAGRWVIKFFGRLFDGEFSFQVEREAARLVTQDPAIRAVPVIAEGQMSRKGWYWPYLVFPFIQAASLGEQACQIDKIHWLSIASELGDIVRRLHALPLKGSAVFPDNWDGYRRFLQKQRCICVKNHQEWGSLPEHLIGQIEEFLPPVDELIDISRPAHLIHADLTRDHLLGSVADGYWKTQALIDFGDAMTGSLLYELCALHMDLFRADRDLLSVFLDSYGLSPELRQGLPRKAMATALLHQFNLLEALPEEMRCLPNLVELSIALWETGLP